MFSLPFVYNLIYGASTWTLTKILESKLDGTYTRMLRTALNISWRQHPTKVQLYGNIPPLTTIFRERRMQRLESKARTYK